MPPSPVSPPTEPPKKDWAEFIVQHEEPIRKLVDGIAEHFHREFDASRKHSETIARAQARTGLVVTLIVFGLLAAGLFMTFLLVSWGLLSGETFVFSLGTLLGALIAFVAEKVTPLLYPPEEVD